MAAAEAAPPTCARAVVNWRTASWSPVAAVAAAVPAFFTAPATADQVAVTVAGAGAGDCYRGGPDGCGGGGGSQTAGGSGGAGGQRFAAYETGNAGQPGKRGRGGNGGSGPTTSGRGGGGSGGGAGGGYCGGGGGGAGSLSTSGVGGGGGGGGGSSYVEKGATHVKNVQGAAPSGNGQITSPGRDTQQKEGAHRDPDSN